MGRTLYKDFRVCLVSVSTISIEIACVPLGARWRVPPAIQGVLNGFPHAPTPGVTVRIPLTDFLLENPALVLGGLYQIVLKFDVPDTWDTIGTFGDIGVDDVSIDF